jgi:hypothetical protein
MKFLALIVTVGGWVVAVSGLLVSDEVAVRMPMAAIGFGTAIGGVLMLNRAHLEHAIWKAGGK